MTTSTAFPPPQPGRVPRRYTVRRYEGDNLVRETIVTAWPGPASAARKSLTATGSNFVLTDRRPDRLTAGATRWTLAERGTRRLTGSVTVTELGHVECVGCPSTARHTNACPTYGIDAVGAWLCTDCCTACCSADD